MKAIIPVSNNRTLPCLRPSLLCRLPQLYFNCRAGRQEFGDDAQVLGTVCQEVCDLKRFDQSGSRCAAFLSLERLLAHRTDTFFCSDKSVTAVVIKVLQIWCWRCCRLTILYCCCSQASPYVHQGLAEHKDELGAPLCPCRHYDDKKAEVAQGFWNCPCVPMRERRVRQ